MDFFSRSRYYNKNYGYPSTSDEGYFFSEMVNSYEFYHLEFTISESFKELRCYFRDWQSVYYAVSPATIIFHSLDATNLMVLNM